MKKLKLPKFTFLARKPKKLQATITRRAPSSESYYDEEPKTNLSSAFIVVLILHVVAVAGIYAFNSLRASRSEKVKTVAPAAESAVGTPLVAKAKTTGDDAGGPSPKTTTAPVSKATVHHVQAGDNLTKIATAYSVTVADLEEANGLKSTATLRPGQALTIPPKGSAKAAAPAVVQDSRKSAFLAAKSEEAPTVAATANGSARTYTVVKGDTPTSIAKKFGTTSADLLKLNKLDDPTKMRAGLTLKLPPKKN